MKQTAAIAGIWMVAQQHNFNKDIEKMESVNDLHDKKMEIYAVTEAMLLDVFSLVIVPID